MSISEPKSITYFLALLLGLISLNASATECFKISPTLKAEGDAYYEIGGEPAPTSSQLSDMTRFFKSIAGDWEGRAVLAECYGSERNPDRRETAAEIDASANPGGNGTLRVDYEIFFIEKSVRKLENLRLDSGLGNQSFDVGSSSVAATAKTRISNANGSSRLEERVIRLSGSDSSLKVEITTYVNGYLAAHEDWRLNR